MIKQLLYICVCSFFTVNLYGQSIDEKSTIDFNKNAISISVLGTTPVFGLSYDRLIGNKFFLELGLGYTIFEQNLSLGSSLKVTPMLSRNSIFPFFIGISTSYVIEDKLYGVLGYLPLGAMTNPNKKTLFSFDLGPGIFLDGYDFAIWGNIKLGHRF